MRTLKSISALSSGVDPDILVSGRLKSFASVAQKMRRNGLAVHQVLDIIGIRTVTRCTADCYRLVRRIHSAFPVLAREYDDYIAVPKPNGYRSLHTTVITTFGHPVEIQIRTGRMDADSRRGPAAHFHYKNTRGVSNALSSERRGLLEGDGSLARGET